MRFVLYLLIAMLLLYIVRDRIRRYHQPPTAPVSEADGEVILQQCAHCGVFVSAADAVGFRGKIYCCTAHVEMAQHG